MRSYKRFLQASRRLEKESKEGEKDGLDILPGNGIVT